MERLAVAVLAVTALVVFAACKDGPVGVDADTPDPDASEEGSWMTYSPIDWTHDGRPFRSTYCDVFSDGASDAVKRTAGEFTDAMFLDIMDYFGFQNYGALRYPPGFDKIDVYINKHHERNIAAAYWGSIFLTVRTQALDTNRHRYLFRHELAHQFEFLVEGTVELNTDVWFREGIAIHVGGGMGQINDVSDLDAWMDLNADFPNGGNPISIHQWDEFPEGSDITGYYTVFDAVMRYILDKDGLNKTPADILGVFYAVRDGEPFADAFDRFIEVDLTTFEQEIFDRLRTFLDA